MIVRPLIKSELLSLLQFTTQGPLEVFSSDLIPEVCSTKSKTLLVTNIFSIQDYGGSLKSMVDYYKVERKLMETKYKDWLPDSVHLKEIRLVKTKDTKIQPVTANFSHLEID